MCRSPSWIKGMTLTLTLTGLFDADLRNMLWMEWMLSCHLAGRKDVRTRPGPVPVSKTLPVGLDIFDFIPYHI